MMKWAPSFSAAGVAIIGIALASMVPTTVAFMTKAYVSARIAAKSTSEEDSFDLTLPFGPALSAAETFLELAEASKTYSIDYPDYYGSAKPDRRPWLADFEARVASDLGKEAGVFLPSGTMAQLIVLCCAQKIKLGGARIPALPAIRRPFFAHPSSHLLLWEQESHARLLNIPCLPVGRPSRPLRSTDLAPEMDAAMDAMSSAPPCAVILEVPHRELGGAMTSWDEIKTMRALCDAHDVHFHMDGARLWEAMPYFAAQGVDCHELCAQFDSVYVSFYKGLGGMTGAMLVGSQELVDEARVWLRRFGGNLFTLLPYAVSDMRAYDKRRHSFEGGWEFAKAFARAIKAAAAQHPGASSRVLVGPRNDDDADGKSNGNGGRGGDENHATLEPTCSLMHVHLKGAVEDLEHARDQAAVLTRLKVFGALRPSPTSGWFYFEWNIGEVNGAVAPSEVERAWSCFFQTLTAQSTIDKDGARR